MDNLELLRLATDQGIIDISLVAKQIELKKEEEYLKKHHYSIWENNGYWFTHLVIDEKRKLIKKKNRRELEKFVINYYKELDPELKPTFKQEFDSWIKMKEEYKEVKESSILRYKQEYDRYFKNTDFENTKVEAINDIILDEFIRSTIISRQTTTKAYAGFRTVIIGVLKYAKKMHHTDFSVGLFFRDFQVSRTVFKKPSAKRKNIYTVAERERLYKYLLTQSQNISYLALALMCLTGLRIGELVALKKEDNISDCHLYIRRTETRCTIDGGKIRVKVGDTPKMDHEEVIVIPKSAQHIINLAYMQTHDAEYLFSENKVRITGELLRRRLRRACKEAGVEYKPPHQMRKTFGSLLLANGVDEAIVKKEMRHKDISTTRSYYHYITESDKEEAAIIDKVMGI